MLHSSIYREAALELMEMGRLDIRDERVAAGVARRISAGAPGDWRASCRSVAAR